MKFRMLQERPATILHKDFSSTRTLLLLKSCLTWIGYQRSFGMSSQAPQASGSSLKVSCWALEIKKFNISFVFFIHSAAARGPRRFCPHCKGRQSIPPASRIHWADFLIKRASPVTRLDRPDRWKKMEFHSSIPTTQPIIELLGKLFCCPNRKRVFSWPKLTAKHARIHLNRILRNNRECPGMNLWFFEIIRVSRQQDRNLRPTKTRDDLGIVSDSDSKMRYQHSSYGILRLNFSKLVWLIFSLNLPFSKFAVRCPAPWLCDSPAK